MNNYISNEKTLSKTRISGDYNGKPVFILMESNYLAKLKPSNFFRLNDIIINNDKGLLIEVIKNDILEFTTVLFNDVKNDKDLIKILNLFIDNKIKNINWNKLRGNFAEALYIKKFGGKKIPSEQKFDIQNNNKYFEIKSFSESKGTVMIKQSQIKDDVQIIGVSIRIGDGDTIQDLAKQINDKRFSEELTNKYDESNGGSIGFVCEGIWELNPKRQKLKDNVIDANLIFEVNTIKGVKL